MPIKATYPTPILHVADVERSLLFYARLGFATIDFEPAEGPMGWARAHCEGGALMFQRAEEAEPGPDRFLLYLYCEDLPGLREQLVGAGIEAGPIEYPEHMASGELCLRDPDGYVLLIGHWGESEHAAWLQRLEAKRPAPATGAGAGAGRVADGPPR